MTFVGTLNQHDKRLNSSTSVVSHFLPACYVCYIMENYRAKFPIKSAKIDDFLAPNSLESSNIPHVNLNWCQLTKCHKFFDIGTSQNKV